MLISRLLIQAQISLNLEVQNVEIYIHIFCSYRASGYEVDNFCFLAHSQVLYYFLPIFNFNYNIFLDLSLLYFLIKYLMV